MQNETDLRSLLRKENSIWGGKIEDSAQKASRIKSPVSISISDLQIDQNNIVNAKLKNAYAVNDDVIPGYVLFPVTEPVKNGADISFIKTLSFSLYISYHKKFHSDIINTLKLWTLFGGVGARTRRGTGSLFCEELLKDIKSGQDIANFVTSLAKENSSITEYAYPRIAGAQLYTSQIINNEPAQAWHKFLTAYGKYRQERAPGSVRPGRSYWPEPDAIRLLTNPPDLPHAPKHHDSIWFPRAAFGLPILTRFTTKGDPVPARGKNFTLVPDINSGERFPSPVILKVIQLADKSVINSAIILNQKYPEKLKLEDGGRGYTLDRSAMPFHAGYETSKIMKTNKPLNGKTIYAHLAESLNLREVA